MLSILSEAALHRLLFRLVLHTPIPWPPDAQRLSDAICAEMDRRAPLQY